jgi:hypothetical protein
MHSFENLKKYLTISYELIDLKASKYYILSLALAERNFAQLRRDADHIFGMTLRQYDFDKILTQISKLEQRLDLIKLDNQEIDELISLKKKGKLPHNKKLSPFEREIDKNLQLKNDSEFMLLIDVFPYL